MTPTPDHDHLLADVLAEQAPPDFREALLGDMLRRVRQKRRFKQLRQRSAALGMAALLGFLAWRHLPQIRVLSESTTASYALVHTQVLATNAVIHTHPFAPAQSLLAVSQVAVVRTSGGQFRTVGDAELLALAARPAVLVRLGPHLQILVFADSSDRNGFPVN
jgi:hypothetical protein